MNTRTIVYTGLIAAAYTVATLGIAPLSYGPLQFRVSGFLYPLALLAPEYAGGFALGVLMSNLFSPFGVWDWAAMPIVSLVACLLAWRLARWQLPALILHCLLIAAGVALFPLGQGAGLPFIVTFPSVLVSQLIIVMAGWLVLRRYFSYLKP